MNAPAAARRFVPASAEARRSNLAAAALVGALTPLLGWLKGFADFPILLVIGVMMALLTFGFYWMLGRLAGGSVIEVGEHGLAIERKGNRTELLWSDIAAIRFGIYGGDTLAITCRSRRAPLRFRLDGHGTSAIAEMRTLLEARLAAEANAVR